VRRAISEISIGCLRWWSRSNTDVIPSTVEESAPPWFRLSSTALNDMNGDRRRTQSAFGGADGHRHSGKRRYLRPSATNLRPSAVVVHRRSAHTG
jgi:hypothetical protein